MRFRATTHILFVCCLGLSAAAIAHGNDDGRPKAKPDSSAEKPEETPAEGLSMSAAVACRSIDGYENYEVLPGATLTADEKLLVYYRPLNYGVEQRGEMHRLHLTQDGQIRRRGEKRVLLRKEKLLDYESKTPLAPESIYLKNTISLKGLKPGEYEYDIILHDKVTQSDVAKQTLLFRIVAAKLPKEEGEGKEDSEQTEAPPRSATRKRSKP